MRSGYFSRSWKHTKQRMESRCRRRRVVRRFPPPARLAYACLQRAFHQACLRLNNNPPKGIGSKPLLFGKFLDRNYLKPAHLANALRSSGGALLIDNEREVGQPKVMLSTVPLALNLASIGSEPPSKTAT
jgi:hypothetical protein